MKSYSVIITILGINDKIETRHEVLLAKGIAEATTIAADAIDDSMHIIQKV